MQVADPAQSSNNERAGRTFLKKRESRLREGNDESLFVRSRAITESLGVSRANLTSAFE